MHQILRTSAMMAALAAVLALVPLHPAAAGPNGAAIVAKSDCAACHAMKPGEAKKMGPNFPDIAAKYKPSDAGMLANVIRKGGSGHWGSMAMPPHPQLSEADAKTVASWILSMKKGGKPAGKPAAKPTKPPKKK